LTRKQSDLSLLLENCNVEHEFREIVVNIDTPTSWISSMEVLEVKKLPKPISILQKHFYDAGPSPGLNQFPPWPGNGYA